MNTLVNQLTAQTQELKELYLKATEEFAKKDFVKIEKWANASIEEWYAKYEIPTKIEKVHNGVFVPKHMLAGYIEAGYEMKDSVQPDTKAYSGKALYKMRDKRYATQRIAGEGVDAYVAKQLKLANSHYTDSIAKLAFRIAKKGLNESNLTLTSSRIAMNFETIITDGIQKVKAFTILAWGEINAPHYRYLIK